MSRVRLILSGCGGRMGRAAAALAEADPQVALVAGIDPIAPPSARFPVCRAPDPGLPEADVAVDFSTPAALSSLLDFALGRKLPLVLAATGYTPAQEEAVRAAARSLPILRSPNLSLGVNLLLALTRWAAQVLGGEFDVEILERHHRAKVDAPSGTAIMLADAAREGLPYTPQYVYERQSVRRVRGPRELGILSLRGGTIAGDHEVVFAGADEVVELRHHAASRDIYARGALRAAKFLAAGQPPGLYTMGDLLAASLTM